MARWRYEGWPKMCPTCAKEVENIEKGGWVVRTIDGGPRLVHLPCLPRPTKEVRQFIDEFRVRSVPEDENCYEREVALSFVKRATELNLAVIEAQGLVILHGQCQEDPEDLTLYCWEEVPGETWEEFRDQCNACIEAFLRTVSPREGLAFYFEVEPEEEWPWLKTRREEIRREKEEDFRHG
jgi:hypothetical protein